MTAVVDIPSIDEIEHKALVDATSLSNCLLNAEINALIDLARYGDFEAKVRARTLARIWLRRGVRQK